jgi:hypothetical protein
VPTNVCSWGKSGRAADITQTCRRRVLWQTGFRRFFNSSNWLSPGALGAETLGIAERIVVNEADKPDDHEFVGLRAAN